MWNSMGVANYIVLERNIEGLDTMMDGKGLACQGEALEAAAQRLGVRPLLEFFSADPNQVAEFMRGEGMEFEVAELPPLQQFPAEEGLATVRALLTQESLWDEGLLQDLRNCECILGIAAEQHVGWHLEGDF
jgi:hypothetical protein